jgi:hypothetical protein
MRVLCSTTLGAAGSWQRLQSAASRFARCGLVAETSPDVLVCSMSAHCAPIVPSSRPASARSCTRSLPPLSLLRVCAPCPRPLAVPHRWLLLWRLLYHPQQARPGHSDPLLDGFPPRRQDPRAEEPAGPLLRRAQGLSSLRAMCCAVCQPGTVQF